MFFLGRIKRWLTDQQRNIFHYHDGTTWRRADPVLVGRKIEEELPDYLSLFQTIGKDASKVPPGPLAESLRSSKNQAADKLTKVAYSVFGLKPLGTDEGVTEAEALSVMVQYLVFMTELATAAAVFPTSPEVA